MGAGYKPPVLGSTDDIRGFWSRWPEWFNRAAPICFDSFDEVAFNSTKSITATSEATAQAIASITVDTTAAAYYKVEFSCPSALAPTSNRMYFVLFENNTAVGQLASLANGADIPVSAVARREPGDAAITWEVRAWVSGGTGTLRSDFYGTGKYVPVQLSAESFSLVYI